MGSSRRVLDQMVAYHPIPCFIQNTLLVTSPTTPFPPPAPLHQHIYTQTHSLLVTPVLFKFDCASVIKRSVDVNNEDFFCRVFSCLNWSTPTPSLSVSTAAPVKCLWLKALLLTRRLLSRWGHLSLSTAVSFHTQKDHNDGSRVMGKTLKEVQEGPVICSLHSWKFQTFLLC